MTESVQEREAKVEAIFLGHDDWMERYEEIIKLGNTLAPYPEEHRSDAFKVKGCQSQVWLHPEMRDGLLHFDADSDASITKGLAAMMVQVFSDLPPAEVAHAELGFLERIGLREHLSPTRSNGLSSMVKQMKLYAAVLSRRSLP